METEESRMFDCCRDLDLEREAKRVHYTWSSKAIATVAVHGHQRHQTGKLPRNLWAGRKRWKTKTKRRISVPRSPCVVGVVIESARQVDSRFGLPVY